MVTAAFTNRAFGGSKRILTALLGLSAVATLSLATPYGSEAVSAVQAAQDDLEEFLARSPGERGNILALKGKGKGGKYALAEKGPVSDIPEEALGRIFDMSDLEDADDLAGLQQPDIYVDNPVLAGGPGGFVPGGFGPGGFGPGGPLGGGGGIGGGGGGGGGTPPGGGGTPPGGQPPVGPIPEPGTWVMLIFGFGAIGGALRRRRYALGKIANA